MRQKLIYFSIFLILFVVVFRSLLFNLSSALIDWRDYALMVWIMFQNMNNILTLNFGNYFETNAFYPNPYTLLFSDLLLPQSILSLPFYLLTRNLILSFNLVFIITFILNYVSVFMFWKQIFKKDVLAFFGSLLIIFSPFFHIEYSHFQMLCYWPFFFSLYFLLKGGFRKYAFISGLFLSIQFLASVYLSFYLLACIAFVFLIKFLRREDLRNNLFRLLIIVITFFVICGVFIKGYVDMKNTYAIDRNIEEYIAYSANLSDYIFSRSIDSVIHNLPLMEKWNSQDHSNWAVHAAFPGFLIFVLSLIGIFIFKKDKKNFSLILNFDDQKLLFFIITITGFVFSLGPRLIFNGTYAHIVLPYAVLLKFVSVFESIRVSARWSFLFYFGLIYFALLGFNKITNNRFKNFIFIAFFIIFVLEYLPLNIKAESQNYYDDRDLVLKNLCQNKKEVLLELPVTHLNAENDIAAGLSYITKRQLASTQHQCLIINGYSGYDLPSVIDLASKTDGFIDVQDTDGFLNVLKEKNITLFKFNPDRFPMQRQANLQKFLDVLNQQNNIEQVEGTIYRITN